jgi:hypothetical protein
MSKQSLAVDEIRVITTGEFAKLNGLSIATVKRIFAEGLGPPVIQLSTRRVGIRLVDAIRWQEQRVRS